MQQLRPASARRAWSWTRQRAGPARSAPSTAAGQSGPCRRGGGHRQLRGQRGTEPHRCSVNLTGATRGTMARRGARWRDPGGEIQPKYRKRQREGHDPGRRAVTEGARGGGGLTHQLLAMGSGSRRRRKTCPAHTTHTHNELPILVSGRRCAGGFSVPLSGSAAHCVVWAQPCCGAGRSNRAGS